MSYNPTNWVNGQTPINASNLNHIEQGIKAVSDLSDEQESKIADIANNQIPEEYLQASVDNYIANNQAGLATKTDINNLSDEIDTKIKEFAEEIGVSESVNYNLSFNNNISYMNDGSINTYVGWYSSDAIAIAEGHNSIYVKGACIGTNESIKLNAISFLDQNKNYISGEYTYVGIESEALYSVFDKTVPIPDDAKYFVVSGFNNGYTQSENKVESRKNPFADTDKNENDCIVGNVNIGTLKHKIPIVAFIFDDSLPLTSNIVDSCGWLVDYFNNKNLKFSVCLSEIAEPNLNLKAYADYQKQGHEILVHSKNHGIYTSMSEDEIINDIVNNLKWHDEYGLARRGFVYPGNSANDTTDAIIRKYFDYSFVGSTGTSLYSTMTEENAHMLSRFGAIEEMSKADIIAKIDEAIGSNQLLVLWGHAYRIGASGYSLSKDDMREILDYIAEYTDSYRLLSLGINSAIDYIAE